MQQQPPRPEVDLSALPEPLRRQLAEAQRLAAEAAAAQAAAPAATPAAAGPTGPRKLDDRQMLEAEAVRRRRLQDAFLREVNKGSIVRTDDPKAVDTVALKARAHVALRLGVQPAAALFGI